MLLRSISCPVLDCFVPYSRILKFKNCINPLKSDQPGN